MDEETALERQVGTPRPRKPYTPPSEEDRLWGEVFREYLRLKDSGMPKKLAAAVFSTLLKHPGLASSARVMLGAAEPASAEDVKRWDLDRELRREARNREAEEA